MRKNILFTLLLCFLLLACTGMSAFAAAPSNACGTGTDDDGNTTYLTWSLSGGTLTISGKGAMEDYSVTCSPTYPFRLEEGASYSMPLTSQVSIS